MQWDTCFCRVLFKKLMFSNLTKERVIMALFGKKKKEVESAICSCGGACASKLETTSIDKTKAEESGSVKILGTGCSKCNQLEKATREALKELGMDIEVDHVSDFAEIASYGVMTTPALVVDEKLVSYGKTLKKNEVIKLLQKARG